MTVGSCVLGRFERRSRPALASHSLQRPRRPSCLLLSRWKSLAGLTVVQLEHTCGADEPASVSRAVLKPRTLTLLSPIQPTLRAAMMFNRPFSLLLSRWKSLASLTSLHLEHRCGATGREVSAVQHQNLNH